MKIFKLFLIVAVFLIIIPIAFAPGENDTKVMLAWYNDNSTAAGERPARSDLWTGQGFYVGNQTDNKNYNLSHVTLWIRKDSSPTLDLDVCIDTFDSGNPQVPKSKQIICNLTVESTVSIQGYFRPYNISIRQADGSLYELNASKNYAIIANGSDSGSPNQYVLQSREANSYLNESAYQTFSPPGSWSIVGTRDVLFEVWVFNGSASTPDITPPIINVSINNTSPKYGEWLNITANITDETGLSTANITYNMSGVLTKANYTLSSTTATISNLTNITCTRGCVINFTVYATDTSNNVKINSTLITVADTLITFSSFSNTSDLTYNKNQTINWTCTDSDIDAMTINAYFERTNPPTVQVLSSSSYTNFTTNMTTEGKYFLNVTCTSNSVTAYSTIFNISLDVSTPSCSGFPANNTFYRATTNVSTTCTDNIQLFEINSSIRDITGATIYNSTNISNLTGTSFIFNTTISISELRDGQYNLSQWAGDTKNKLLPIDYVNAGYDGIKQQFNSTNGMQINITFGILLPDNTTFFTIPENILNKKSAIKNVYVNNIVEHFETEYNLTLPSLFSLQLISSVLNYLNIRFAIQIKANMPIQEVSDTYPAHLLIGSGRNRLSYDAEDLSLNGFNTSLKKIGSSYYNIIEPKAGWGSGTNITFRS